MKKKTALPDELLDMVSGGVLTIGGEAVDSVVFYGTKEIWLWTKSGTQYISEFTPEGQAAMEDDSLRSEVYQELKDMIADDAVIRFEDYIGS